MNRSAKSAVPPLPGRWRRRVAWPVLAFSLIFAAKAGVSLLARSPWIIPDETDYAAAAQSTWSRGQLIPDVRGGQPYPPGYSLALAPAYAAASMRVAYHLMLLINCLLTTLTGVAAYAVARRLLANGADSPAPPASAPGADPPRSDPRHLCLAVGLAVSLAPSTWLYSYVLMSESLFALLFVVSCWLVLRMGQGRSVAWAGLLGALFALMFLTRSVSVALLPALLLVCLVAGRATVRTLARIVLFLAGAAAGIVPWLLYKRLLGTGTPTGYGEVQYLDRLTQVLSSGESFLTYLRILGNDMGALAAGCAGVFFVLSVVVLLRRATWRAPGLRSVAVYGFAGMLGTLFVAGLHQFEPLAVRGMSEYAVLSRYFDTLVPAFVVVGGVALWRFRSERWHGGRIVLLIAAGAAVFALLGFVLPTKDYKTPNTLGVWHLFWLRTAVSARLGAGLGRVGPWTLYGAFAVVTVWALCDRRAHRGVLAAGLLLAACGVPTVREVLRANRATARDIRVGAWLRDHAGPGAGVYVDETMYAPAPLAAHREVLMLRFWNPEKEVVTRRRDVAADRPRYLISADPWPSYRILATGGLSAEARWTLYEIDGSLKPLTDDPGFIDLATVPADRLEGFHGVDAGDYRWTSGRSVVHLPAPPRGVDLEITLGMGGGRPSTEPAHVRVYFDDHLLAEFEKRRGGLYRSFRVPASLAAGSGHRLEFQMNTFRPADFPGWPDDTRDLGVQLFWIKIRSVEERPIGRSP